MADWTKILSRGSVDDRRGVGGAVGGLGIAGVAVALLLGYLNTGSIDPGIILSGITQLANEQGVQNPEQFEGADEYEVFASTVLGSANDYWSSAFARMNRTYEEPELVLFRGSTSSSCGGAASYIGPHYCPPDSTIYLDETFFDDLRKLGAEGDVAQAYVIAHEVGHHAQAELGLLEAGGSNAESVQTELQADCFAGLWAYSIRDLGVFGPNEIEEAIAAAAAVGDDRIQEQTSGRVNKETWTHGSSADRIAAFTRGFESGDVSVCMR